jgi:predicted transcriptional regulator
MYALIIEMFTMNGEEKKEVKVYVQGRLVPIEELEEQYPEMSLATSSGTVRIVQALVGAEKPLNREEIAKKADLSEGFTRTLLKRLKKGDYALEFRLGGGKIFYYLLTEKGLKLSKEITAK